MVEKKKEICEVVRSRDIKSSDAVLGVLRPS